MKEEVNNIEQLVNVIYNQLLEKDYYLHNYRLLDELEDYLERFVNPLLDGFEFDGVEDWKDLHEEDIKERIFDFFEYDYAGELIFPMEL